MIRDENAFRNELNQSIDFDTVLKQIASFASFSCSKDQILSALPRTQLNEIQPLLDTTDEAIQFEQSGALLNFSGCSDITMPVLKAKKQITLSGQELSAVANFLAACARAHRAFEPEYTHLYELSNSMDPCDRLMKQIYHQIDMTGSIKDDATPLLKHKTKELIDARLTLQAKGRQFLKKHKNQLMENMTTTIQGRLSVLVKASDKNVFGGLIHGQSQSGMAYYVEPNEFVSENNRIQVIENDIEAERKRICKELTLSVSKVADTLLSNLETMTIIDVALTKARWAIHNDGCVPVLHRKDHSFYLEAARHPLIDAKKVVANTYSCKNYQYCLMISGPNMGGKTVTLKTIGLFVALSHAGFPILCQHAHLPFYTSIWFDIGDNQSITNNLSTFSSHISKVSEICRNADENTFVLLDELGNGTDPLEGASLAIAILDYLIQKRSTIITSTHYNQVKSYGKTNRHVLVSSVEFDAKSLKPTYRYVPGVSGASYAFSIAKEYHLDDSILAHANQLKDENTRDVDAQLERLEKLQMQVRKDKERFETLIADAHRIQKEASKEKEEITIQKQYLDETYQEDLNTMLEEKKDEAQTILRELRKRPNQKLHHKIEKMHELNTLSEGMKEEDSNEKSTLKVGDYVQMNGLNSHGEIIDIRRNEATVNVNGMKTKIKLNRLTKITKPNTNKVKIKQRVHRTVQRFPLELNLIGMHVDEALSALDQYIDQAVLNRTKQVRIVHGMGTGALRNAVLKDLEKHPSVKETMSAGPNEGGLGATIVVLR